MAQDIHVDLTAEKHKQSNTGPWVWTFAVPVDDDDALRVCAYTEQLTIDGDTYDPAPIQFDGWSANTEDINSQLTVTVFDVDRQLATYLEQFDGLRDKPCTISLYHTDHLDNSYAFRGIADIQTTNVTETGTVFVLGTINLFTRSTLRKLSRERCIHHWGGQRGVEGPCGFDNSLPGAPSDCSRDLLGVNGCASKGQFERNNGMTENHPANFGGQPATLLPTP